MTPPVQARHRGGARRAAVTRPRYGRITAFATAVAVTGVTVAAGVGLLPTQSRPQAVAAAGEQPALVMPEVASAGVAAAARGWVDPTALPAESGTGRRVVFDQSAQRVWLVRASGAVARSYLVSGSVTDNLRPGSYAVYSRSRWAVGVDDSGVMQYFVRFAHGDQAAIGFHTIPTKRGVRLQTKAQLGTPQSHGCIRQATPDAVALWRFAPLGTSVVVTA